MVAINSLSLLVEKKMKDDLMNYYRKMMRRNIRESGHNNKNIICGVCGKLLMNHIRLKEHKQKQHSY